MHNPDAMATSVVLLVKTALAPVLERLAAAEARLSVLGDLRDRVVTVETKALSQVERPQPDMAPLLERIAAAETGLALVRATEPVLADLRDRVLVAETKAAMPAPVVHDTPVDVTPLLSRLSALEQGLQMKVTETSPALAAVADLTKDMGALRERVAVVEVRPAQPGPQGEPGPPGKDGVDGKDGTAGLTYQGVYQDGKSYEPGDMTTWAGSTWHCSEPTTTKPGDGSKAWTLVVKRGRDGRDGLNAPGALPVVSVERRQA